MEIDKLVNNFIRINDNFAKLDRRIIKQAKKIKWLKIGCIGLAFYCAGLALELAERKRSENYLQEEIDELKEKLDGGSADA